MYFWAAWRIFSRSMDDNSSVAVGELGGRAETIRSAKSYELSRVWSRRVGGFAAARQRPFTTPFTLGERSGCYISMKVLSLADIERAATRIAGKVRRSPLSESAALSRMSGASVYLKLENLQFTGSFKERGAANRLLALPEAERERGVITASAGNH